MSQESEMEYRGLPRKRASPFQFTEFQLVELQKKFKSYPYIKGIEKRMMATNLGITPTALENWFRTQRGLQPNLAVEVINSTIVTG